MSPVTILPNEGTLLNYVLALIISLLKRAGAPDQSPQENNVFAIIAQKKLLAMICISFWGVQNLYLKGGRLFYDLGQLCGLRNNGDFLTFNLLINYGFGDTHMAGKILKYVNECFNTWECKSWSEIIYVTTTGFCIILCCMSLCLLCM